MQLKLNRDPDGSTSKRESSVPRGASPRLSPLATALLACALLDACRSDDRLGPVPGLSASHTVLGTFAPPTPSYNEQGFPWGPTGIMIPDGVHVRITMTGFIHFSPNPGRAACNSTPLAQPPLGLTSIGPSGYPRDIPGAGGGISVDLIPNSWGQGQLISDGPSDGEVYVVGFRGPGEVWTSRRGSFPGSCWSEASGYQPDYFVSGTQTLIVETVEAVGIEVVCTGSGAPRGSTVSCEARPQPSTETLVVTGWKFTAGVTGATVTREVNVSAHTWAGQFVTDGRIDVTGTVATHTAAGAAALTVTPRDWSARVVRGNHTTPGAGPLLPRPTAFEGQLGLSQLSMRERPDLDNYAALINDGGPNHGFYYLTDIPYETFTIAWVNYPAMAQGSDWYNLQYPNDKRIGQTTYCGRPRVLTLPPLVEAHEGTDPPNQPNSHIGIYITDVTREARSRTEGLVGLGDINLPPVRDAIHQLAAADSKAMDNDSRNNIVLPCVFRFFTS